MSMLQRNGFKVRMFHFAMRVSNALASLPNKLVPPPFRLIQISSAYWQSRAVYVAADLGVADVIGDDELTSDEIAGKLKLHADYLYRLLRMLASIGIFEEYDVRSFRNNKLSHCLRSDSAQSVRAMVLLHNSPEMSRPWFEALGPSLRNGEVPFVQSHGEELFNYLDQHPKFDRLFTAAMEAVPTAQSERDIYLFIAIFHGIADAQAEKILTNLRKACASHHPTIAIIDCVAEQQHIDPTVAGFDMQMLIGTRGRERTEAEWRTLLEQGGFSLQEIVSLRTFARLLVVNVC